MSHLTPPSGLFNVPTALVVGHPGHELRVHHWLELSRPMAFVLTDGSGATGQPRLDSTARVLECCGAQPGGMLGRWPDAAFYAALLARDLSFFLRLADELAESFVRHEIACVAGDAVEGYNPVHDVCRHIIDAAVRVAESTTGRPIASYDFPLVGPPDECSDLLTDRAIKLQLGDAALERKLIAARNYPEMAGDVAAAVERNSLDAFRVECLRPVETDLPPELPPFYERHGESRVGSGRYNQVIRFADHIAPVRDALRHAAA